MLEYYDKYLELDPMWHVRGLSDVVVTSRPTPLYIETLFNLHLHLTYITNSGLGDPSGERRSPHFLDNAHLLHFSGPVKPWERLGEAMGQAIWNTYYLPDPWRQFKVLRKAKSKSTRLD